MSSFMRRGNCLGRSLLQLITPHNRMPALCRSQEEFKRILCTKIDYLEIEKQREKEELETALNIEKSLFEQSNIKYEPRKVSDVIRESRSQQQKLHKPNRKAKFVKEEQEQEQQCTEESTEKSNLIKERKRTSQSCEPTFHYDKNGRKSTLLEDVKSASETIQDRDTGLEFIKLHQQDSRLFNLMTTVRSRKRRDKEQLIVLEGRRLINEALRSNLKLYAIIFSQREELKNIADKLKIMQNQFNTKNQQEHTTKDSKIIDREVKIYKVPHHDLKIWSILSTPPGLMAIFKRPTYNELKEGKNEFEIERKLPITVVCDNIREPNNLGSIIRTCAALPCQQIILTKGCCDPWESKALRTGCGGQFRVLIVDDVEWERVPLLIPPEVVNDCHIFVAENKKNIDSSHLSLDISNISHDLMIDYTTIQKIGKHNLVIIGGETHGISTEAYGLLKVVGGERGKCLHIPIAEGMDSLNVVSALTLILYELRRHLLKISIDMDGS